MLACSKPPGTGAELPDPIRQPTPRHKWLEGNMVYAIQGVKLGYSVNAMALRYSVPATTLRRRLKDGMTLKPKLGRPTALPGVYEEVIAKTVRLFARANLNLRKGQLKAFAQELAVQSGNLTFKAGRDWYKAFKKRYPDLGNLRARGFSEARFNALTEATVDEWAKFLEASLGTIFGGPVRPDRVFNMDESPMNPDEDGTYVLGEKGKPAPVVSTGYRDFFTAVVCVSATGTVAATSIIIEGNKVPERSLKRAYRELPVTIACRSGHTMSADLFTLWLQDFYRDVKPKPRDPVVLLVDNHKSHVSPLGLHYAYRHNIHIIGLPPNTTSALQPLDVGVFGPMKQRWREEIDR